MSQLEAPQFGVRFGSVAWLCYAVSGRKFMRLIKFALSTTALLFSLHATAQEPIDFSGVWQMDPSRSESAHQATPIGSFTLVIKQAATELSIETRRSEKPKSAISSETLTFKLDGSENSIEGNYGVQIKAKAHWDGTKLITETERSIQGSTVTTTQVFSLDASRKEMTVDNTLTVQHGYQSQGANNTGRGKDVFIKSRRSVNK